MCQHGEVKLALSLSIMKLRSVSIQLVYLCNVPIWFLTPAGLKPIVATEVTISSSVQRST